MNMNRFTINGVVYNAPKFDFNTVCDFEEAGISIAEAKKKPTSMIRAYFALLFDGDKDAAGKELEKHMVSGGSFEELTNAMIKEMNESDFFRALTKRTETEDQSAKKTRKKEDGD